MREIGIVIVVELVLCYILFTTADSYFPGVYVHNSSELRIRLGKVTAEP